MSVLPIFFSALRLAVRARYVSLVFFSVVFLVLSAALSAGFSGRQPEAVSLDVGLSVIRIMLPVAIVLLSQELIFREFERRYSLGVLSYPISRICFFLGRFLAVFVLALFMLVVMAFMLKGVVYFAGEVYGRAGRVDMDFSYLLVMLFMVLEVLVLTSLACFLGVAATTSGFILIGTFGFMLVARSYVSIVELLSRDAGVVDNVDAYGAGLGLLVYLLPDLGSLDVRMIALYGRMEFLPSDWLGLVVSCVGYILFLLSLAVWVIKRKRIF